MTKNCMSLPFALNPCSMPTAPFVPYWVVAQREDTDMDALKSMVQGDILELEEEDAQLKE